MNRLHQYKNIIWTGTTTLCAAGLLTASLALAGGQSNPDPGTQNPDLDVTSVLVKKDGDLVALFWGTLMCSAEGGSGGKDYYSGGGKGGSGKGGSGKGSMRPCSVKRLTAHVWVDGTITQECVSTGGGSGKSGGGKGYFSGGKSGGGGGGSIPSPVITDVSGEDWTRVDDGEFELKALLSPEIDEAPDCPSGTELEKTVEIDANIVVENKQGDVVARATCSFDDHESGTEGDCEMVAL